MAGRPAGALLETYVLKSGLWTVAGVYKDQDQICAAPFDQITLALNGLWAET